MLPQYQAQRHVEAKLAGSGTAEFGFPGSCDGFGWLLAARVTMGDAGAAGDGVLVRIEALPGIPGDTSRRVVELRLGHGLALLPMPFAAIDVAALADAACTVQIQGWRVPLSDLLEQEHALWTWEAVTVPAAGSAVEVALYKGATAVRVSVAAAGGSAKLYRGTVAAGVETGLDPANGVVFIAECPHELEISKSGAGTADGTVHQLIDLWGASSVS